MTEADHRHASAVDYGYVLNLVTWLFLATLAFFLLSGLIHLLLPSDLLQSFAHEDLDDYSYEYLTFVEDGDTCCICQESFTDSIASNEPKDLCVPIQLKSCGHVVGDKCFRRWVASFDNTRRVGSVRCPYCTQLLTRKSRPLYRTTARAITTSIATIKASDFPMVLLGYNRFQQPGSHWLHRVAKHASQIIRVAYGIFVLWSVVILLVWFVCKIYDQVCVVLLQSAGVQYFGFLLGVSMLSSATLTGFHMLLGKDRE